MVQPLTKASAAPARAGSPRPQTRRGAVAGVVTLAAWAVIYFALFPLPPRCDRAPHEALGRVLGEEAVKLQQPGGRIILITRDTESFQAPAFEAQVAGLQAVFRKAGVKIAVTRVLKVDPLRVAAVPPGDFLELLRKASEKDVVISLLGPPVLDDRQLAKLDASRPRVVAVCSGAMPRQVDLMRLFDQKLIDVAVISRLEPAPADGTFENHFKLVTAANIAELPPFAAAP